MVSFNQFFFFFFLRTKKAVYSQTKKWSNPLQTWDSTQPVLGFYGTDSGRGVHQTLTSATCCLPETNGMKTSWQFVLDNSCLFPYQNWTERRWEKQNWSKTNMFTSPLYCNLFWKQSSSFSILLCVSFVFFKIGVQLIYNVVLVSGVQESELVVHIHIFTLFKTFFPIWVMTGLSAVRCAEGYC